MNEEGLLFRYRTVSEHSIKELLADEIVISSLDTFNDPCDSTIVYTDVDYYDELIALRVVASTIPSINGKSYFDDPKKQLFSQTWWFRHSPTYEKRTRKLNSPILSTFTFL